LNFNTNVFITVTYATSYAGIYEVYNGKFTGWRSKRGSWPLLVKKVDKV